MSNKTATESTSEAKVEHDFANASETVESGTRLINSAIYIEAALEAREDIRESLEKEGESDATKAVTPTPSLVSIVQACASFHPSRQEDIREAQLQYEVLWKMSEFLRENTLESHKEALRVLKESGLLANQRWNEIHTAKSHRFSKASDNRVNSFADLALRQVPLDNDSVILELGTGAANDAKHLARRSNAHLIGVDISEDTVKEGVENIERAGNGVRERINLIVGNFFDILDTSRGAGVSMVYSHSTLHYAPPLILREKTFPLIADVLRSNQEGAKWGKLCMAMKTAASASAQASSQIKLLPGNPYNPSVDTKDKLFRVYPETKKDVLALLEPSFNIEYARLVPVRNYDRKGDTEIFCYVIASPKPKKEKL